MEVITFYNGRYGRIFVLVSLGIGCTVWYGFVPGVADHAPEGNLFAPLESYDHFFNMDYTETSLHKVEFLERNDVTPSVELAMGNAFC